MYVTIVLVQGDDTVSITTDDDNSNNRTDSNSDQSTYEDDYNRDKGSYIIYDSEYTMNMFKFLY